MNSPVTSKAEGDLDRPRRRFKRRFLVAGAALLVVIWLLSRHAQWLSPEAMYARIEAINSTHPLAAPLLFILAYVLLSVLMLPTLPLNLGAGVLWGGALGSVYTVIGTTAAAGVSFLVSRYLLYDLFSRKFSSGPWRLLKADIERNDWKVVAFTRLNPAFPTGVINYGYGITDIPLLTYLWSTCLFITPASVIMAYVGQAAGVLYLQGPSRDVFSAVIIFAVVLTLFLAIRHVFLRPVPLPATGEGAVVSSSGLGIGAPGKQDHQFKTTLLVMTLNEVTGMKEIMPKIRPEWCEQTIIVDGGSTDGTIEWAREHGYTVYVQKRKGIRYAYMEVLPLVEGDVILTFSPDGNSLTEAVPQLLDKMRDGYDMVIASRYLGPAKSQDDDLLTGFGNWLFTSTVNLLHGGRYTDAMVILRAYRKSMIQELDLDKEESYTTPERLFHTIISWEPLLSVRAAKARYRITEIPADEPPRMGGERKLQLWRWGAAYYFQFWSELFCWRKNLSALRARNATKSQAQAAR